MASYNLTHFILFSLAISATLFGSYECFEDGSNRKLKNSGSDILKIGICSHFTGSERCGSTRQECWCCNLYHSSKCFNSAQLCEISCEEADNGPVASYISGSLIAKPGCVDKCGSLSIPYPFGLGPNCSRATTFYLICNTSTSPPKVYFDTGLEIVEITTSYIRVKYPYLVAGACYNDTELVDLWRKIDLVHTRYSLSDQNWVTTIGCNDIAVGIVNTTTRSLSSGCAAYCSQPEDGSAFGFCPGNGDVYSADGCCRAPIPRGSRSLEAQITDVSGKWLGSRSFSCSYAFVEEKGASNQSGFRYPFSVLDNPTAFQGDDWPESITPPVVRMDWRVGTENCSEAQRDSSSYACAGNSVCVDFDPNIGGYLCNCSQGFEGNPYLTPGCIDINECGDGRSNPCHPFATCTNTPGNYNCTCLDTYYGDGKKNGTGCIQLPHARSKTFSVLIGLGIGLGLLLLASACFWLRTALQKRKIQKHKEKFSKRNAGLLQQQTNEGAIEKIKLFQAKELEKATDHFNESRILGQGGQGTVYKGMLSDGKIVAIKKSKHNDHLQEFINEVAILTPIYHKNVVTLLGCCLETEVPLLVYEFVPNGTLSDLVHDASSEFPVSWNMRLRIAADVAGALSYLHSASAMPIYHRDIKSSNVLLGEKFAVKVSDFGTSKTFAVDETHQTTMVKGTLGYLDPEYLQSGQFTEKSDVYSFGIVMVELLTGQRPTTIAGRFLASMDANSLDSILDPQVSANGAKEEVITVARLAQRCLNLIGRMRPTMKEVAIELGSLRMQSQMGSSGNKDECCEELARAYEGKAITISDNDYTWTTGGNSVASSSSDVHPLMIGNDRSI